MSPFDLGHPLLHLPQILAVVFDQSERIHGPGQEIGRSRIRALAGLEVLGDRVGRHGGRFGVFFDMNPHVADGVSGVHGPHPLKHLVDTWTRDAPDKGDLHGHVVRHGRLKECAVVGVESLNGAVEGIDDGLSCGQRWDIVWEG